MELAQLICECSSELSGARRPLDVQLAALSLNRVAHRDTAVLRHAPRCSRAGCVATRWIRKPRTGSGSSPGCSPS